MQNPLAALSMPTLLAESATTTSSVGSGDASFAGTFVEAGFEAEDGVRPDDAVGSDIPVLLSWPVMIVPRAALLAASDAAVDPDGYLSAGTLPTGGPDALRQVVVSDAPALVSFQDLERDTVCMVPSHEFAHVRSPAVDFEGGSAQTAVVESDASIGGVEMLATEATAIVVRDLVAASSEGSASVLALVSPVSKLRTDGDEPRADGPQQIAGSPKRNQEDLKVARTSDAQTTEKLGSPPTVQRETYVLNDSRQPDVRVKLLDQTTAQLRFDGEQSLLTELDRLGPTSRISQLDQPDAEIGDVGTGQASLGPPVTSAGIGLATDVSSDLSPVPTSNPSHEVEPAPQVTIRSFWERFFSDPTVSAPHRDLDLASDVFPPEAIPTKGTAVLPVLAELSANLTSEMAPTDPSHQVESSFEGPVRDLNFPKISPKSGAALVASKADSIGNSSAEIVVAEWENDFPPLGQGTDFLQSLGSAALARASAGHPISPSGMIALPVSQVASQLADVLVRSPGTVTELALAPEELGRVKLRMEPDAANPDRMIVLIIVERPETLDLFRRHAGELAEAIRSAGFSGADIGFGQNGQEGNPKHGKGSPPAGSSLPFDEFGHIEPIRMLAAGTSLDLRL